VSASTGGGERPLRVAIDANVLEGAWGGIPKYLTRISSELVARGDELSLLANTRRLERPVPGAHEVGIRIKGTSVWREVFLPLWLARNRPDVLWAPESHLPRLQAVPSVITIHDLASLRFPGIKPDEHARHFRTAVARSARRAARVIAVSQTTADDVASLYGIDAEKVKVVPNGVDPEFSPGDRQASAAAVRERWGIEEPYVLHVGSLEPRKGVEVLIEAAEIAARDGAPWRVALAGATGFDGRRIEAAVRASGACTALGPVGDAELVDLLRAAGALAAPALYEGFGITPLEAMACGTPAVISAGSGGLEEVSGPASIVVPERTPQAWRSAIERALERPPSLIEAGLRHAAGFRWPHVAAQTRDILAEAAQAGRR
jgi:glycosyltransferase involved in cell wall biosynthesis